MYIHIHIQACHKTHTSALKALHDATVDVLLPLHVCFCSYCYCCSCCCCCCCVLISKWSCMYVWGWRFYKSLFWLPCVLYSTFRFHLRLTMKRLPSLFRSLVHARALFLFISVAVVIIYAPAIWQRCPHAHTCTITRTRTQQTLSRRTSFETHKVDIQDALTCERDRLIARTREKFPWHSSDCEITKKEKNSWALADSIAS